MNIEGIDIKIDSTNEILVISLPECLHSYMIKDLIELFEFLILQNEIRDTIIMLPRKWKASKKCRKKLRDFLKHTEVLIVSSSPIQRAILKTELIYDGIDPKIVCNEYQEALDKISKDRDLALMCYYDLDQIDNLVISE